MIFKVLSFINLTITLLCKNFDTVKVNIYLTDRELITFRWVYYT